MWVRNLSNNEALVLPGPATVRTETVECCICHAPGQLILQPFVSTPPAILCPTCNLTIYVN